MSDRIQRKRGKYSSYSGGSEPPPVDRRQLKALYRESRRPHGAAPVVDPGPESTVLGSVGVADDEPTRVGQELASGADPFAMTTQNPSAHPPSPQAAPGDDTQGPSQQRRPSIHRSKRKKSHKRGSFSKVVANHVDPPPRTLHLPFISDPDSPLAASYRILRHKLRQLEETEIIAITSPGRHEGKTTVAINLAMAIAEHGRENVLLLEANLRHPSVGMQLGFTPPSCFGQQMASHLKSPLDPWNVVSCFFPNLHVLAVDPASVGSWRMSAPALSIAIDQLGSSDYGYLIIDCPSTLGSADVNIIEDMADGILFTAKRGQTKAEELREAQRHLAPANFLGVVMVG